MRLSLYVVIKSSCTLCICFLFNIYLPEIQYLAMKFCKTLFLLAMTLLITTSFTYNNEPTPNSSGEIEWLTWEEAVKRNEKEPRKIFVDVYTDWCGYCKKMDKTTFLDKNVTDMLDGDFYAVKFDAEQREDIVFQNNTFKFVKGGRKGAHQLASALLDGRLSFPSFVILDSSFARIMLSPGYKEPRQLLTELSFAKDEQYKVMSWKQYKTNPRAAKSKT